MSADDRPEAIEHGWIAPAHYRRPDDMPPEYYSGQREPQQEDTDE